MRDLLHSIMMLAALNCCEKDSSYSSLSGSAAKLQEVDRGRPVTKLQTVQMVHMVCLWVWRPLLRDREMRRDKVIRERSHLVFGLEE